MAVNSVTEQNARFLAAQFQPRTPLRQSASDDQEVVKDATSARPPESMPEKVSEVDMEKTQAVKSATLERTGTQMRLDEASKQIIAQIMGQNGEVIQQIPPEERLQIMERVRQVQGLIFDELA